MAAVTARVRAAARRTHIAIEKLRPSLAWWGGPAVGVAAGVATGAVGSLAIRSGWLPSSAVNAVSAAAAGVTFVVGVPLVRSCALTALSAAASTTQAALSVIGGAVVTILAVPSLSDALFSGMPPGSRPMVVNTTTLLATIGGIIGISLWVTRPRYHGVRHLDRSSYSGAGQWDMDLAARHEAGHALVAVVLGMPLYEAHVKVTPDAAGIGGHILIDSNRTPTNDVLEVLSGLLRQISVAVAGVLAEQPWPSARAARRRLGTQKDFADVCGHMFSVNLMRPQHGKAGDDIFEATWEDIRKPEWQAAKAELATALVATDVVPADVVKDIAKRHELTLPCVQAVIARILDTPQTENNDG